MSGWLHGALLLSATGKSTAERAERAVDFKDFIPFHTISYLGSAV